MKILVAYVTAGAGHRRAAEAAAEAVRRAWPDARVDCVDTLALSPRFIRESYNNTYLFLVRRLSRVWQFAYGLVDHPWGFRLLQPLRRAWNLAICRRFVGELKREPPDAVITTHFLPNDLAGAGRRAGWLTAPVITAVTDLYPHRLWLTGPGDAYVLATEDSAAFCRQRGVPADRLHVLGIPTRLASGHPPVELQAGRLTLLVTSGGTTVGRFEEVVHAIAGLEQRFPGRFQLIVVCGQDEAARSRLAQQLASSAMPVHIFGFVQQMVGLMALADAIVAKAGGLTVTESLAQGVPLVLYHMIPGQEQLNAEHAVRHGAGVIAESPEAVQQTLAGWMEHPDRLDALKAGARRIGKPHAADDLVRQVLAPLLRRALEPGKTG